MTTYAIALGSNLGDRLATLREAVRRIDAIAPVVARSRIYETDPVGPPQPDYLNAAVLVEWSGAPLALLGELQRIESELGRVRAERNGPRTLDLDVLWSSRGPIEEDDLANALVVPHPRLSERAFALRPLLDVVPDAFPLPREMAEDPCCRVAAESLLEPGA